MIEIHGKYGKAIVHTDYVEPSAYSQIQLLLGQPMAKDANALLSVLGGAHLRALRIGLREESPEGRSTVAPMAGGCPEAARLPSDGPAARHPLHDSEPGCPPCRAPVDGIGGRSRGRRPRLLLHVLARAS